MIYDPVSKYSFSLPAAANSTWTQLDYPDDPLENEDEAAGEDEEDEDEDESDRDEDDRFEDALENLHISEQPQAVVTPA